MIKTALKLAGLFLATSLVCLAIFLANLIWFKPFFINHFFERVFIEFALEDPEMLSSLRLLEPFGLKFHQDDLTDASPARAVEMLDKGKRDLATLRRYEHDSLPPRVQLSYDILDWFLQNAVEGEPWLYHNYPVNQLFGVQNDLPDFMVNIHQINDARDARDYVTRLTRFPEKFGQVLEGLKLREEKGIVPPKFVIARVLEEMRGFVALPPAENILYTSLAEKLAEAGLPEQDQADLRAAAATAIEAQVYPAYESLIEFCAAQEQRATTDDGVWKLPDGDAYYAYALRSETTSSMTPEEVHGLGLTEVARIHEEMTQILDRVGAGSGTVSDRVRALAQQEQFLYPDSDEGRAQALADYQAIIDEIDSDIGKVFDLRPAAGVRVERVPQFKEKTAPGAYYRSPALDGSRPGIFYANLRDMSELHKFGMRTLAYHEAIPGHHFQIAIQQEIEGPMFRKMPLFTAYTEGWALYAEQLAWEQGYQEDPYSNLGRLQAELFRAVRLVVDTGIHHKRWTREEAIAYMEQNTGMPQGDVVAEIERYIVNPGQACAYKVGMIKILALRERARKALGPAFDLKRFHNVLLKDGAMPLDLLEEQVERYIAAVRPSAQLADNS